MAFYLDCRPCGDRVAVENPPTLADSLHGLRILDKRQALDGLDAATRKERVADLSSNLSKLPNSTCLARGVLLRGHNAVRTVCFEESVRRWYEWNNGKYRSERRESQTPLPRSWPAPGSNPGTVIGKFWALSALGMLTKPVDEAEAAKYQYIWSEQADLPLPAPSGKSSGPNSPKGRSVKVLDASRVMSFETITGEGLASGYDQTGILFLGNRLMIPVHLMADVDGGAHSMVKARFVGIDANGYPQYNLPPLDSHFNPSARVRRPRAPPTADSPAEYFMPREGAITPRLGVPMEPPSPSMGSALDEDTSALGEMPSFSDLLDFEFRDEEPPFAL